MAHTTVNSGFWSGGTQEQVPLDGSTNHGARLRKVVAPEPAHEEEVVPEVAPEPQPVVEQPKRKVSKKV